MSDAPAPPVASGQYTTGQKEVLGPWTIAVLVLSVLGWTLMFGIGSVLALLLVRAALLEIKTSNGRYTGRGLVWSAALVAALNAVLVTGMLLLTGYAIFGHGTSQVTVPNVTRQSVPQAAATLKNAHLAVGTETFTQQTAAPFGTVISQNPAAGSLIEHGHRIDLVVSARTP